MLGWAGWARYVLSSLRRCTIIDPLILGISGQFISQPLDRLAEELATNLHGPVYLMRMLLPGFVSRGNGCVINIVSRAGTVDMPMNTNYAVSKAALIRLTSCVQEELNLGGNQNIHLYSLHPGALQTKLTTSKPRSNDRGESC